MNIYILWLFHVVTFRDINSVRNASSTLFLPSNSMGLRDALNIDLGKFKWHLTNSSSQKLQLPHRKPKKMKTKNINKQWNATGS